MTINNDRLSPVNRAVTRAAYRGDLYRADANDTRLAAVVRAARVAHRLGASARDLAIECGVPDATMTAWLAR